VIGVDRWFRYVTGLVELVSLVSFVPWGRRGNAREVARSFLTIRWATRSARRIDPEGSDRYKTRAILNTNGVTRVAIPTALSASRGRAS
jgi:hypothetical protein